MRAQFIPYLEKNIWQRNANQANLMATKLALGLQKRGISLAYPVQTNQVFAYFSKETIEKTQKEFPYYIWCEKTRLVRLVTSFDTTDADVDQFLRLI